MTKSPPVRVLLVDDKPNDGELSALVLHHLPHAEITVVDDAIGFAEQLTLGNFNLVITERYLNWAEGNRILESYKGSCFQNHLIRKLLHIFHSTPIERSTYVM